MRYRDHDAILQTIDRASKGLYLNKEMVQPTLDAVSRMMGHKT